MHGLERSIASLRLTVMADEVIEAYTQLIEGYGEELGKQVIASPEWVALAKPVATMLEAFRLAGVAGKDIVDSGTVMSGVAQSLYILGYAHGLKEGFDAGDN